MCHLRNDLPPPTFPREQPGAARGPDLRGPLGQEVPGAPRQRVQRPADHDPEGAPGHEALREAQGARRPAPAQPDLGRGAGRRCRDDIRRLEAPRHLAAAHRRGGQRGRARGDAGRRDDPPAGDPAHGPPVAEWEPGGHMPVHEGRRRGARRPGAPEDGAPHHGVCHGHGRGVQACLGARGGRRAPQDAQPGQVGRRGGRAGGGAPAEIPRLPADVERHERAVWGGGPRTHSRGDGPRRGVLLLARARAAADPGALRARHLQRWRRRCGPARRVAGGRLVRPGGQLT
mmetsp:Transcript_30221/g.85226  ORF Transcript_30221/g.85226 Transcript_30221/m.85226 type:complete len:287 (+) Transcript_30221:773-1633(+)